MKNELHIPLVFIGLMFCAMTFGIYGILFSFFVPLGQEGAARDGCLRWGRALLLIAFLSAFLAHFWRNP